MTALAALPAARNPTTRPGRNTRLTRDANIEANLAQITGQVNLPECRHCAQQNGVFVLCVSVVGQLSGSCANCHYNNEGWRCSLRELSSRAVFILFNNITNCLKARRPQLPPSPPPSPLPLPPMPMLLPPCLLLLLLLRAYVPAAASPPRWFRARETLPLLPLPPLLLWAVVFAALLLLPLLLRAVVFAVLLRPPLLFPVLVVDVGLGLVVW